MFKKKHTKYILFLLLSITIVYGCSSPAIDPSRNDVRWAEKDCRTQTCYLEELNRYKNEISTADNGETTIRWHMSVRKIRQLEYGEKPRDGMYYRYYDEDCWFTAIFAESGDVLETEWEGPGCWGDGL